MNKNDQNKRPENGRHPTAESKPYEEYFSKSIIQTSPAYFVAIDAEGKTRVMNHTMLDALGYSMEEVVGTDYLTTFIPERDRQKLHKIFAKLINLNEQTVNENRIITRDGRELLVEWHGQPVYDADGRFDFFFGVGIDITERKKAEEELRKSEERFRAIFDQTFQFIGLITVDGILTQANRTSLNFYDLSESDVVGKPFWDAPWWSHSSELRNNLRDGVKRAAAGEFIRFEVSHPAPDNKLHYVDFSLKPWFDADGKILMLIAEGRDITARINAREALQKSEAHLQSIFRAAPTGIGVTIERKILQANKRLCKMVGYSEKELVGKTARMLYPTNEDFEYVGREKYKQISEHGTGTVETRWLRKDGKIIDVLLSSTPLDINDISRGVTFTALDITDRKLAEMKLRESEVRLLEAQTIAHLGYYVYNIAADNWTSSPELDKIFGLKKSSKKNLDTWMNIIHPEFKQSMIKYFSNDVLGKGKKFNKEYKILDASSGHEKWVHGLGNLKIDDAGNPMEMFGTIQDITERKLIEEAVLERERTLDALINAPIESAILTDTKGTILAINRIGAMRFGKDETEIIGTNVTDYFPSKLIKSRTAMAKRVIRSSKSIRFQDELDGRYYDNNVYPVFDDKNNVTALAIYARDITRHRQAERMMRSLVEGTAKATGRDFFDKLVQHLAKALDCKFSIIGLLDNTDRRRITTLSYWNRNKIGKNFNFDITGTPCEQIDKRNICFYRSQASIKYPDDKWLAKNKIQAFLGIPLKNPKGKPIGMLAVMDTREFSDDLIDGAHSLMTIFASRASAEIKRIIAEDEQRVIADRLREEQKALFDKNVALRQILEHMETERHDFRHEISTSMEQALMPFVKKLRNNDGNLSNKDIELFEDAVKSITGTEIDDFKANYSTLTSREMDICDLIKEGKSSQEIADFLHLSLQTIQKHRSSIRKKLQLKNKEINLPAYLRYK